MENLPMRDNTEQIEKHQNTSRKIILLLLLWICAIVTISQFNRQDYLGIIYWYSSLLILSAKYLAPLFQLTEIADICNSIYYKILSVILIAVELMLVYLTFAYNIAMLLLVLCGMLPIISHYMHQQFE